MHLQDKAKLEKELRKNFPPFANSASSDFQYAFKIRVSAADDGVSGCRSGRELRAAAVCAACREGLPHGGLRFAGATLRSGAEPPTEGRAAGRSNAMWVGCSAREPLSAPLFSLASPSTLVATGQDKANPKDWTAAENLTFFPSPEDLGETGLDQLKKFFSSENLAGMFKAPQ